MVKSLLFSDDNQTKSLSELLQGPPDVFPYRACLCEGCAPSGSMPWHFPLRTMVSSELFLLSADFGLCTE